MQNYGGNSCGYNSSLGTLDISGGALSLTSPSNNIRIDGLDPNITIDVGTSLVGLRTVIINNKVAGTHGNDTVAIGDSAGETSQGNNAIAVGALAGNDTQGSGAIAIGDSAGETDQGNDSVAIGKLAGNDTQGTQNVAIGEGAGELNQDIQNVADSNLNCII